jgi:hypothetical protein
MYLDKKSCRNQVPSQQYLIIFDELHLETKDERVEVAAGYSLSTVCLHAFQFFAVIQIFMPYF